MRNKTNPFTRLQWKLTFSYALVTIAVLGLLYIALFTLAYIARYELVSGTVSQAGSTDKLLAFIRFIIHIFLSPLSVFLTITFGIIIIGTIFGALTSRGLVRRLAEITWHAANWGKGNFTSRILDRSTDEIGELSRDLDRLAGDLQELIKERQRLAAQDERDRLRRDLHDSVKQQLFAANMNLATTSRLWDSDQGESRKRLEAAVIQVRRAQAELNSLIQPDREGSSEDQDLKSWIGNFVVDWEKQSGIHLDIETDGEGKLPPLVNEALYRVTQEALANIARHSQARTARVNFEFGDQMVTLVIYDDGRGFDQGQARLGLGLRSMQDRVERLGGQFQLTSGEKGTCIQVQIPISME